MRRRRHSSGRLRFKLTQKQGARYHGSVPALLVGGGLFCAALALFFDAPTPEPGIRRQEAAPAWASPVKKPSSTEASDEVPVRQAARTLQPADQDNATGATRYSICGKVRYNCVVDGDTFWARGEKIRIADIDTPEISRPGCREEHALGIRATTRLMELLNQGPFELRLPDGPDRDRYGRALRRVERGGVSIGDQLIDEGLARRWEGRRKPWC